MITIIAAVIAASIACGAGIMHKKFERKVMAYERFVEAYVAGMATVGFRSGNDITAIMIAMSEAQTRYEVQEQHIKLYASYRLRRFLEVLRERNDIPADRPLFLAVSLQEEWAQNVVKCLIALRSQTTAVSKRMLNFCPFCATKCTLDEIRF